MQFGGYQVQTVSDLEAELIVSVLVSFFRRCFIWRSWFSGCPVGCNRLRDCQIGSIMLLVDRTSGCWMWAAKSWAVLCSVALGLVASGLVVLG